MFRRSLYYSQLASRSDVLRIADIAKVGRVYCSQNKITGLLIFDGLYLCEYLEGPQQPMTALIDRITADARHTQMVPLVDSYGASERLFEGWDIAYMTDSSLESLKAFQGLGEDQALAHFMSLLSKLDRG